jgi:hypothetical protein
MKLSTKPRHFAPVRRVRDLSGKMHNRVDNVNSTRPGKRWSHARHKQTMREALLSAAPSKQVQDQQTVNLLYRLMRLFRRGR